MRTIIISLLFAIFIIGCKHSENKVFHFSELSGVDRDSAIAHLELIHMPTGVLSSTLTPETARIMSASYTAAVSRTVVIENVPLPSGTANIRMSIYDYLHNGMPAGGFPSYRIEADTVKKILAQSGVKYLLMYPALRVDAATHKPTFTLVLLGAGSDKEPMSNRLIYEYIDPCPPPRGCRNL